jgi:dTDP-4-amino-4,6-dideoxygalactose transaminase
VIEDCAHTMGAEWNGTPSGRHGLAACYSTQTYKHINSGEGGLITSDDPDLMARAIILSGSYMLLGDTRPDPLWIRSKM